MPFTRTMITCHPEAHMGSISYTREFVTSWALAQQYYKEVKDGRDIRKGSFPPLRPIDVLTVLYFCLLFILYYWYFDSFLYFYIPAFSFRYFLDERRSRKVMQLMWTYVADKVQTKKIHHGPISRSLAAGKEEDRPLVLALGTRDSGHSGCSQIWPESYFPWKISITICDIYL